jgi:integrase
MNYLSVRGRKYYYYRRIPAELKPYHDRNFVRIALKTDLLSVASKKAEEINLKVEKYWSELIGLNVLHDKTKFQQALKLANLWGVPYIPNEDLIKSSPTYSIAARVEALETVNFRQADTDSLLGAIPIPIIDVAGSINKYWEFTTDKIINKSQDQIRKWKNPRIKAIRNFIAAIGNKNLAALDRVDILNFRDWWIEKIQSKELTTSSANKDFIHVKSVFEVVNDNLNLGIDIPKLFKKIIMKEHWSQTRLPFDTNHIISVLLNPKSLVGLSDEEKCFLFAFAETGARGTELVGLLPEHIILDHKVPHIQIRPRRYKELKTDYSKRDIPLVGFALMAFQQFPNGFKKYHDKPDQISTHLNKFLRENKIFPSDQHSVYSLRHSFQDRLTSVNAPDRIQAELMGHKFDRPQYGDGPSLELKLEWMQKIQLK